ncbi:arginine--tRNA ligase [Candidatus Saccharibacteria bacterium]|nr:arginine--tRNA ligase [Candidatus Saccharibacteria bacterium]
MEKIRDRLKEIIRELFGVEMEPEVTVAPDNTGADFASNVAMKLAKEVGKSPREVAEKIVEKYEGEAEVAGPGFLNFRLGDEYYLNIIEGFQGDFSKNISQDEYSGKKVICEFSDPNPFKVLHVGHLYTSIVGEAISKLFELSGAEVVRANFGGDVGLHVAKTIFVLRNEKLDDLTIEEIARCYVLGTRAYEEDENAKAEIVQLNKEIYEIAQNNRHDSELAELYWRGRELSYQYFEDFYESIGVKFDKYYPESTVAGRGLTEVKKGLEQGVYEMSDGAVVYRGEKVGLHTRVFINKDGLPTYEAKDVGLIFTKWDDYRFDKSVVITGNDIIDYMKVVLSSVGEMNAELPKRTAHLTHGQVKLPGSVKMSSRKGNFLKAVETIGMVREELGGKKADEKVVQAAVKYAFLKYKVGGDIIFDPKESVATTGNSGVYLLYSTVRSKKIIEKCTKNESAEGFSLNEFEKKLCKKMAQYGEVIKEATKEMAPHKICNYLYEISQEFSRFYENVKVAGSEFEQERKKIVQGYEKIMEHGLNLLGIEVPDEM